MNSLQVEATPTNEFRGFELRISDGFRTFRSVEGFQALKKYTPVYPIHAHEIPHPNRSQREA